MVRGIPGKPYHLYSVGIFFVNMDFYPARRYKPGATGIYYIVCIIPDCFIVSVYALTMFTVLMTVCKPSLICLKWGQG